MKKEQLREGATYIVRHLGQECRATLVQITEYDLLSIGRRTIVRYRCRKLTTNRLITFKSALPFIREDSGA